MGSRYKYSMGSLPSASPLSAAKGALGASATMGQIYIRPEAECAKVAIYDLWGAGAGLAAGVNIASFWQSENDFDSLVECSGDFSGTVTIREAGSVQFIVGYTMSQSCIWLSGKNPLVRGTECSGGGFSIALAVGANLISNQFCRLNFVRYEVLPWLINS